MPLPLAHSLAAAAVYKGLDADGRLVVCKRLALALIIGLAPDLDLLPGILIGEPDRWHHVGFSHSLVFAAVAAIVVGVVAAAAGKRWPISYDKLSPATGTALMVGLLLASHAVLDTFNLDLRPPAGPPIFWPFPPAGVTIYPWFVDVAKASGPAGPFEFVLSVLTLHNLRALFWELVTVLPILIGVVVWRNRRDAERKGSLG